MSDETSPRRVAVAAPRPNAFIERVRLLAEDTSRIKWSRHALDRMAERDIPIRVALNVIRQGYLVGQISAGDHPGEWKAKIVRNVKGRRDVGVILIVVRNNRLFVKTVEWEDLR